MKVGLRKLGVVITSLSVATAMTGMISATARAADAAPPQDAHVKLLTPYLDATNTSEAEKNQKMADGWVANGWFGTGVIYQRTFVPVGSTTNLTYHVTDKNGNPLVNQKVKLRVNKGYSTSTSILQVDNVTTKGVDKPPLDQGTVFHYTDAFGNVTFSVKDLDAPPLGEPQPESWTAAPNISADGLNDLHSQMLLEVAGEKPDHSVFTEFHYYIPKSTPVVSATHPTIRLVTPVLDDSNSIHRADLEKMFSVDNNWYAKGVGFRQVYAPTGSKFILAYKVTDDNGAPLANTEVKLHVNKAYSKSNASITDGKTATDKSKDDSQGNDQALYTATTDALGYAVFTLQNTDTKGEAKPATWTTPTPTDPTKDALFTQIFPEITGAGTDVADFVEIHFYGNVAAPVVAKPTPKPTQTTISCVKGKTMVKVKAVKPVCPKGYTKK